jgi:hypothetical protein
VTLQPLLNALVNVAGVSTVHLTLRTDPLIVALGSLIGLRPDVIPQSCLMDRTFVGLSHSVAIGNLAHYICFGNEFFIDGVEIERESCIVVHQCKVINTYILYVVIRKACGTH